MIEIIGWLGSLCFALYSLPQMISVVKNGNARVLSPWFLVMLWTAALFSLIYVVPDRQWPLIANFGLTLINATIMLKYKFFERK